MFIHFFPEPVLVCHDDRRRRLAPRRLVCDDAAARYDTGHGEER